jgi:hypothetical protein
MTTEFGAESLDHVSDRIKAKDRRPCHAFMTETSSYSQLVRLHVTNELLGDLGELYFRHLCVQRGFGYLKLEDIHKAQPAKVLEFKFLYERIPIAVPPSIVEEIARISKPLLVNGTKSFVFDFLTCKVYDTDSTTQTNGREPDDFCWVEIKSGMSRLSPHQFEVAQTCKMRFSIFRIKNVASQPRNVELQWAFDSQRYPSGEV